METSSHDILIIGGGGAGLRAAIAIAETNPSLDVAVVSKVYPMRSHTVSAEGGAAAVAGQDDRLDEHAYDTISGGDWLCDQDAVEIFVNEAPKELLRLEHWGCPWSREPDGQRRGAAVRRHEEDAHVVCRRQDRLPHAAHAVPDLAAIRSDHALRRDVRHQAAGRGRPRVQACVAIELATGKVRAIAAKAVIICTGGCGRVFPFTTNANIKTGDGMALAYRAGAPLKDMEFVQYHPTGLPFTGILITEAARAPRAATWSTRTATATCRTTTSASRSQKPVLRSMELGPRDRLSQAFVKEMEKGRTHQGPVRRRTSTWTCAIWARRRSTPSCRSSASCA